MMDDMESIWKATTTNQDQRITTAFQTARTSLGESLSRDGLNESLYKTTVMTELLLNLLVQNPTTDTYRLQQITAEFGNQVLGLSGHLKSYPQSSINCPTVIFN